MWANISEMVHAMINVSMRESERHIWCHIYDLSVYLMTFGLGWPLKVRPRSQNFQNLYLINDASCDQSLYEIYIMVKSFMYMAIQFYEFVFDLWQNWKGKSRSLSFKIAIFHKPSILWLTFIINTYGKSYIYIYIYIYMYACQFTSGLYNGWPLKVKWRSHNFKDVNKS